MLATFPNGKVALYRKIEGIFAVVNLDYDQRWADGQYHVSRPTRKDKPRHVNGLPATARFPVPNWGSDTIELYEGLERWAYKICRENAPHVGEAKCLSDWRSLLSGGGMSARFMTDFAGSDTNRSWVLGTNPDADPIKVKGMGTGGTIVKLTGESTQVAGEDCHVIDVVDPLKYWDTDPVLHWWRFFCPTNSVRREVADAKGNLLFWVENISEPFHHFGYRVKLPLLGVGGRACIQKSRVRVLSPGERPSPFVNAYVPALKPYTTPFYRSIYG